MAAAKSGNAIGESQLCPAQQTLVQGAAKARFEPIADLIVSQVKVSLVQKPVIACLLGILLSCLKTVAGD